MVLEIVKYGHPVLREKGAEITEVTPELNKLIASMVDTMYEANGVGLAAQQVAKALQVAVVDVSGVEKPDSWMKENGKKLELEEEMPMILINPKVNPLGKFKSGVEGCLSFPDMQGSITRHESVEVTFLDPVEQTVRTLECGGLLARAVQHEVDHLNGVLFIDRMAPEDREKLASQIKQLAAETKEKLKNQNVHS